MNNKIKYMCATIVYILLACCTDSIEQGPEVPADGAAALRVTFILPGEGVSSRAVTYIPGTSEESRVDSIRLYVFAGTGDAAILRNSYTVAKEQIEATGEGEAITVAIRETGALTVIAVANPRKELVPGESYLYPGMSYGAFTATVLHAQKAIPTPPFVMWDEQAATVTAQAGGDITTVAFNLVRAVARIDLYNDIQLEQAEIDETPTHPFTLLRARLVQTPATAWLLPMSAGNRQIGSPADVAILNNLPWAYEAEEEESRDLYPAIVQSTLYSFPDGTLSESEDTQTRIEIEGLYGTGTGALIRHTIGFGNRPILPNHLYEVRIQAIDDIRIEATILVSEWEEGGEIPYTPDPGGAPTVQLTTEEGQDGLTTITPGSEPYTSVLLLSGEGATLTFRVEADTEHDCFPTETWITDVTWTPDSEGDNRIGVYTVTFPINQGDIREADIEFRNLRKPARQQKYRVKQEKE